MNRPMTSSRFLTARCVLVCVMMVAGGAASAAEMSAAELRRMEVERIEWFKARTEQLLKETGLTREQLAKHHAISAEGTRTKIELTERQLQQIRAYETEVVARYEAWLKASGWKPPEAPPRRKVPGHFQDRLLKLPPGSA